MSGARVAPEAGGSAAYEIREGIVLVTVTGMLTSRLVIDVGEEFLADPEFEPGMHSLWDLRLASVAAIDADELRRISARRRARSEERGGARTALLVESDLAYGIARMYELLSERPDQSVYVFRDPDAAMAWLRSGSDPS